MNPFRVARSRISAFLLHRMRIHVKRVPKRGDEVFPSFVEAEFRDVYGRFKDQTLVGWQPLYWAWTTSRWIKERGIPGDVVECGVYKGGASLVMASAHDRTAWLYDTYAGMSEPSEFDFKGEVKGERFDAHKRWEDAQKEDGLTDWIYAGLDEVKGNIAKSEISPDRFKLVQGLVEDTIPADAPEKIALLRLDTDFYESTKHELEHLYPRLSSGGIVLVDDYGSWAGSRKACDEYFAALDERPLMLPCWGSANIMLIKP